MAGAEGYVKWLFCFSFFGILHSHPNSLDKLQAMREKGRQSEWGEWVSLIFPANPWIYSSAWLFFSFFSSPSLLLWVFFLQWTVNFSICANKYNHKLGMRGRSKPTSWYVYCFWCCSCWTKSGREEPSSQTDYFASEWSFRITFCCNLSRIRNSSITVCLRGRRPNRHSLANEWLQGKG